MLRTLDPRVTAERLQVRWYEINHHPFHALLCFVCNKQQECCVSLRVRLKEKFRKAVNKKRPVKGEKADLKLKIYFCPQHLMFVQF